MNESIVYIEKLRKLKIACRLFDGLLKDNDGYPANVKLQLEKDLAECKEKIKDVEYKKIKDRIQKKYAKIWNNKTGSEGGTIDKKEFDRLYNDKLKYKIFIVDNNHLKNGIVSDKIYFNCTRMIKTKSSSKSKKRNVVRNYLRLNEYKLIVFTLKRGLVPGSLIDIAGDCLGDLGDADCLRDLLDKKDKGKFDSDATKYRNLIVELNKILDSHLKNTKISASGRIYSLHYKREPKYCYIEID